MRKKNEKILNKQFRWNGVNAFDKEEETDSEHSKWLIPAKLFI